MRVWKSWQFPSAWRTWRWTWTTFVFQWALALIALLIVCYLLNKVRNDQENWCADHFFQRLVGRKEEVEVEEEEEEEEDSDDDMAFLNLPAGGGDK